MSIDPVGAGPQWGKSVGAEAKAMARAGRALAEKPEVQPAEAETIQRAESGERTKGVIRNLMAGHFKGVADVRLRINFFDELNGLQTQSYKAAAAEQLDGLVETLAAKLEELMEDVPGEITAEVRDLLEAFLADISKIKNGLPSWGQVTPDVLRTDLENLFSTLVTALREIASQPAGTAQEELEDSDIAPILTGVAEEGAQAVSWAATLADGLKGAVDTAMDELSSRMASAAILPPLSDDPVKGAAYAKFLKMYEELLAGPQEVGGGAEGSEGGEPGLDEQA
jgi:hypothetical protein